MKDFFSKAGWVLAVIVLYLLLGLGGVQLLFYFLLGLVPKALSENQTLLTVISVAIVPVLGALLTYRFLSKVFLNKKTDKTINPEVAKKITRTVLIILTILVALINLVPSGK